MNVRTEADIPIIGPASRSKATIPRGPADRLRSDFLAGVLNRAVYALPLGFIFNPMFGTSGKLEVRDPPATAPHERDGLMIRMYPR